MAKNECENALKDPVFKIPLYLVNAMKRAAKERGQSLVKYVDDLGAALLLGDTSVFKDVKIGA